MKTQYTADQALQKLKEGNQLYLSTLSNPGDVSPHIREVTYAHGQHPYAAVVACSDSREIPEAIFSCGIGEIFTIRVAGNIIFDSQLGSIEYAVKHLGVPLIVVLGHTNCGAVGAALEGHADGYAGIIVHDIQKAIKGTIDPTAASRRNAIIQAERIKEKLNDCDMKVVAGLYHIENGAIEWLE